MAHDRMMMDWMDALQDFPLPEVKRACSSWVLENSRKMPNEGDIRGLIQRARSEQWQARKSQMPNGDHEDRPERVTKETAARIMAEVGFGVKRMGDTG
jgi:hypothetical protein